LFPFDKKNNTSYDMIYLQKILKFRVGVDGLSLYQTIKTPLAIIYPNNIKN